MPRQTKRKFWQTEKFKELQKTWEERLRQAGFKDVESNGKLMQNASNCYRTKVQTVIENKQRHYELLGQHHHAEDYSDPVEKYVMERWANGAKIKEISEELRAVCERSSRETLRSIIGRYEKKWGVRTNKKRT